MNIFQRMLALDEWEAGKQAYFSRKGDCPYPWTDETHWFKRRQWYCGYASAVPKSQKQRKSGELSTGGKVALVLSLLFVIWGLNALVFGPLMALLVFPVVGILSLLFDRDNF